MYRKTTRNKHRMGAHEIARSKHRPFPTKRKIVGGFEGVTFSGSQNQMFQQVNDSGLTPHDNDPNYVAPSYGTYQPDEQTKANWAESERVGNERQAEYDRAHPVVYHTDENAFTVEDLEDPNKFFSKFGKNISGEEDKYVPPQNPAGDVTVEEKKAYEYAFYAINDRVPTQEELQTGMERVRQKNTTALLKKLKAIEAIEPDRYNNIIQEYAKYRYGYYVHQNRYLQMLKDAQSWFGGPNGTLQFGWALVFSAAIALDPFMMAGLMIGQSLVSNYAGKQFQSLFTQKSNDKAFVDALAKNGVKLNK